MGIYETPYELAGKLTDEMYRACRLVVDTGIHAFDWTREEAIDYLLSNTALSRYSCEAQVDRYISWPGQATAYKMGERTIREIRRRQEKKLGDQFDVKKFHASVLSCIGPLELLEKCVQMQQSDDDLKIYYGKVPTITREPKHLHSSAEKCHSIFMMPIIFILTYVLIQ